MTKRLPMTHERMIVTSTDPMEMSSSRFQGRDWSSSASRLLLTAADDKLPTSGSIRPTRTTEPLPLRLIGAGGAAVSDT